MAKTPKQKLDLLGHKYRNVMSKSKLRASRRTLARKSKRRRTTWYPRTMSGKAAAKTVSNAGATCGVMICNSQLYPHITYKNKLLQQAFNASLQRYLTAHMLCHA